MNPKAYEKKNESDEKGVLRQAQKGRIGAFEKILFQYEKRIFNYLYRILGNRYDAEDAAQEVFIKVYKNIASFDPEREFSPWLYKIATNTAYDLLRAKKAKRGVSIEDDKSFETISEISPYKLIEQTKDLEQELKNLKPIYRTVLILYYWDDLSYKEISDILQIPLNTVKTQISRAKKELKEQ